MQRGSYIVRSEADRTTIKELNERLMREVTPSHRGQLKEAARLRNAAKHKLRQTYVANLKATDFAAWRAGFGHAGVTAAASTLLTMPSAASATLWPTFVQLFAVTADAAAGCSATPAGVELNRRSSGRLPLPGGLLEPSLADIHRVEHKSGAVAWEVRRAAPPQAFDR
jgi:hypothetical protein